MNEEPNQDQLSPEEAKAALGLSTRLSENFLMSQAQEQAMMGEEAPMEGEMPQGEEMMPQTKETPQIDPEALKNEIKEELVGEVKSIVEKEMQGFRESIKEALENEEE